MNLGADPVHRKGHQAHADARVEALDGLHQADIAFLHQVIHGQAIAGVAAGDVHHEAQVRQYEFAGRIEIVVPTEAFRELLFVLAVEHGNSAYPLEVSIKAADRAGHSQPRVLGDQRSLSVHHSAILHLRVLPMSTRARY